MKIDAVSSQVTATPPVQAKRASDETERQKAAEVTKKAKEESEAQRKPEAGPRRGEKLDFRV